MQKVKAYGRNKYNFIETNERKKFFGDVTEDFFEITNSFKIKKIGEGAFGEVYKINKSKEAVIKVVPISDPKSPGCLASKCMVSEIYISKSLSKLSDGEENQTKCFCQLSRSYLVSGPYPASLMEAWDKFKREKTSENCRPDVFPFSQHYVILVYEYAGKDLDSFQLKNAHEALAVFKQVVISLAISEMTYSFEHRDLHIGNILVKRNRSKSIRFKYRGEDIAIKSEGLQATIIDYTFSRLATSGYIYYHDLSNEHSLFDPSEDIQFITYGKMRSILGNEWHISNFVSNVLWIHYLVIVLQNLKYKNSSSNKHQESLRKLKFYEENLTNCQSAQEVVRSIGILNNTL